MTETSLGQACAKLVEKYKEAVNTEAVLNCLADVGIALFPLCEALEVRGDKEKPKFSKEDMIEPLRLAEHLRDSCDRLLELIVDQGKTPLTRCECAYVVSIMYRLAKRHGVLLLPIIDQKRKVL
jgi:hypothetical protein